MYLVIIVVHTILINVIILIYYFTLRPCHIPWLIPFPVCSLHFGKDFQSLPDVSKSLWSLVGEMRWYWSTSGGGELVEGTRFIPFPFGSSLSLRNMLRLGNYLRDHPENANHCINNFNDQDHKFCGLDNFSSQISNFLNLNALNLHMYYLLYSILLYWTSKIKNQSVTLKTEWKINYIKTECLQCADGV